MLDSMVFVIRRLICRLDEPFLNPGAILPTSPIPTYRDLLSRDRRYQPNQFMPLDDRIRSEKDEACRHAALTLNFEFAPEDYQHADVRGGDSSRNPVLYRRVLGPLGKDDVNQVREGIKTARWLLDNVRLPVDIRKQIEAALKGAESRIYGIVTP